MKKKEKRIQRSYSISPEVIKKFEHYNNVRNANDFTDLSVSARMESAMKREMKWKGGKINAIKDIGRSEKTEVPPFKHRSMDATESESFESKSADRSAGSA